MHAYLEIYVIMKTQVRFVSTFLMLFVAAASFAQGAVSPFNWRGDDDHPFIGMRSVAEEGYHVSTYASIIYEVGTPDVPSDAYNPFPRAKQPQQFAVTTEERKDIDSEIRWLGGYGEGDDPGEADPGSPVGDPLSLALFALLFAGIVGYRTRLKKTGLLTQLSRNNHDINDINTNSMQNVFNRTLVWVKENVIFYSKSIMQRKGVESGDGELTEGEASIQHPFSIHSASIQHPLRAGGKQVASRWQVA